MRLLYIHDINFILSNIKKYIEENQYILSRNKIKIYGKNTTVSTLHFLAEIYIILNGFEFEKNEVIYEKAKNVHKILQIEVNKCFTCYDRVLFKKWFEKLSRILPLETKIRLNSDITISSTMSRKGFHLKYKAIITAIEIGKFDEKLLHNYFSLCRAFWIECAYYKITDNFLNEIKSLFEEFYYKNFRKSIKNTTDLTLFYIELMSVLSESKNLIEEGKFLHYMKYLVPENGQDKSNHTSFKGNSRDPFISREKLIEIIDRLIQINSITPSLLYSEISFPSPGYKIYSPKHILQSNKWMVKNILSSMTDSLEAVSKDLHRANYYINNRHYKFNGAEDNSQQTKNQSNFKKELINNHFGDLTIDFILRFAHQGGLTGVPITWILTHLYTVKNIEISSFMMSLKDIHLIINQIDKDTIKIISIGVTSFSRTIDVNDTVECLSSSNIALVFECIFKMNSMNIVNVIEPKIFIANLSDDNFNHKFIYKQIKYAALEFDSKQIENNEKLNNINFIF